MLTFIINLLIIIIFVIIGGVFACTELGLLSLRDTQIDKLEKESEYGEKLAQVVREPNQFLSTVQIGVTLAGMFSASFGTAKLAPIAAEKLSLIGVPVKVGETLSVIILTIFVAYLSLILGELVPKRIAMQKTEQVVRVTGHIVLFLIRFSKPVVYVLSVSTNAVLKLLRLKPDQASDEIDAQEAREIIAGLDELSEG
ncbi:MAG: DUF21 domain-containing protein [Bifidobacteriaceae bacterium]|jgi:putative hemolysin|nr:DUF21 domain-containing protein [Bifidobacteriaceae bacterium]